MAKDNVKVLEEVMLATHAGAKAIGEKVLQNSVVNTEAAFDAAQAIARAKTFPEAARLQANFVQQQLAVASSQTKGSSSSPRRLPSRRSRRSTSPRRRASTS